MSFYGAGATLSVKIMVLLVGLILAGGGSKGFGGDEVLAQGTSPAKPTSKGKGKKSTPRSKTQHGSTDAPSSSKNSPPSRESLNTRTDQDPPTSMKVGVGISMGVEALFGNGVTGQWLPFPWLDLEFGLGLNQTGLKSGIAGSYLVPMNQSWALMVGGGVAYSGGNKSEVTVDGATFKPEGSSLEEPLVPKKSYEVSPAVLTGIRAGVYWHLTPNFLFRVIGNYNVVVSGNKVTFQDGITYDKPVVITNEEQFDAEFRRRAEEEVKAGGTGFSLGLSYMW